jgi:phage terminase large subunit
LTKEYLERLEFQLFGTDLQRLYHGRWCSAEGMVWKNFDRQTHVIAGDLVQEGKQWVLYTGDIRGRDDPLRFEWFFASVDWGFTNPGVLQVWGVDGDNNACRVAEVYRKEKDINWWADKAEDLRKKFDIQHFTCDPSRPENIRVFNKRMVSGGGYGIADKEIASKAKNAKEAGLSVVRERFGRRTVFFWQDALESHDPLLGDDETVINCTEKEIPSYVVRVPKPNQPQPEETDPMCEDHGCDSLRYACMFLDDHDWRPGRVESKEYAIGTYGRVLDHASVFEPQEDNPWWW